MASSLKKIYLPLGLSQALTDMAEQNHQPKVFFLNFFNIQ